MNWIVLLTTLISLNLFASLVAVLLLTAHLLRPHSTHSLGSDPTAAALTKKSIPATSPCASGQLRALLGISCSSALDMVIYEDSTMMLSPRHEVATTTTEATTEETTVESPQFTTSSAELPNLSRIEMSRRLFPVIATCSSVQDLMDRNRCQVIKAKGKCGKGLVVALQCPFTCFCSS